MLGDGPRAERTRRTLEAAGVSLLARVPANAPVWIVRAGAWPAAIPAAPPASATGRPLVAIGRIHAFGGEAANAEVAAWDDAIARSGGDLSRLRGDLPRISSAYLDARAAAMLDALAARMGSFERALDACAIEGDVRAVRVPALDVHEDAGLRVVEVTTSFQRGGAERIALSLVHELRARGVAVLPVVLGRAMRPAFEAPEGTLDLSVFRGDRDRRTEALTRAMLVFGADVVHAHLLDGDDLARLAPAGVPVVVTVHNARHGWPAGLDALAAGDAALLVACSRDAERELRHARLPIPSRTVWNGVSASLPFLPRSAARARHGLPEDAVVLLSVANPRPQKRLHLVPSIAHAVKRRSGREVHVVVAGQASPSARASEEELAAAIALHAPHVRTQLTGAIDDLASLYAAADVLVAPSAYEGLSLVHLEALGAGLPVVTTGVGGAREIGHPSLHLVPPDASVDEHADHVVRALAGGRTGALPGDFTADVMAARYAELLERAARRGGHGDASRPPPSGVLVVTNNFSTGGAQSSLRRLLLGLVRRGIRARAAVLEESDDHPTPGLSALRAAGIPVLAAPTASEHDPAVTADAVAAFCDEAPPAAVLFVNALCVQKLLLVDRLYDVPVFDASPGEMYFASMERYFARPRPGLPYRTPRDYGQRLAAVIVKYDAEAERARETLGGDVHVVPNGVPLGGSEARARERGGPLVLGTIARIAPQKKLEELLSALRAVHRAMPPYVLRIAGAPERGAEAYADELRRLAGELPVEWLGEREGVSDVLAGLDLFVMISEPAGCPNASLEAMAAGLPVVATLVGGASEQIVDGETGRLVPSGDVRAFGEAIAVAARDRDELARWGRNGRARAERLFDVERMVDDYVRILGLTPDARTPGLA